MALVPNVSTSDIDPQVAAGLILTSSANAVLPIASPIANGGTIKGAPPVNVEPKTVGYPKC